MARYTWKSQGYDAYDFNRKCKVQNINQSATVDAAMQYLFDAFGVEGVIARFGVEANVRKTPERDEKGKIKKVAKKVLPQDVIEADEVLEALNWRSNELKFKFRTADTGDGVGCDYYKSVYNVRLDGDFMYLTVREGLAEVERKLDQARNNITDAFMMPITRSGVITTIRYFTKAENRNKMLRTVERLDLLKNETRERWMSKYSILKTDVVIESLTNPVEKKLAYELQVLLYVKFKNVLKKLTKDRFDPARFVELEKRHDDMRVEYSKKSASEYEKWFYNCILHIEALGFKSKRVDNKKKKKGRG